MGEEGQLRTEKKVNVGLQFAKSGSLLASEEGYFDDRSDLQIAEILQDQVSLSVNTQENQFNKQLL